MLIAEQASVKLLKALRMAANNLPLGKIRSRSAKLYLVL